MARKFIIGLWNCPEDSFPWWTITGDWRTRKCNATGFNKIQVCRELDWITGSTQYPNPYEVVVEEVKDG